MNNPFKIGDIVRRKDCDPVDRNDYKEIDGKELKITSFDNTFLGFDGEKPVWYPARFELVFKPTFKVGDKIIKKDNDDRYTESGVFTLTKDSYQNVGNGECLQIPRQTQDGGFYFAWRFRLATPQEILDDLNKNLTPKFKKGDKIQLIPSMNQDILNKDLLKETFTVAEDSKFVDGWDDGTYKEGVEVVCGLFDYWDVSRFKKFEFIPTFKKGDKVVTHSGTGWGRKEPNIVLGDSYLWNDGQEVVNIDNLGPLYVTRFTKYVEPTPTFKAGDKVKRKHTDTKYTGIYHLPYNEVFTLTEDSRIDKDGEERVRVGDYDSWYVDRFEKVTEPTFIPTFKKGDIVRYGKGDSQPFDKLYVVSKDSWMNGNEEEFDITFGYNPYRVSKFSKVDFVSKFKQGDFVRYDNSPYVVEGTSYVGNLGYEEVFIRANLTEKSCVSKIVNVKDCIKLIEDSK